MKQNQRRWDLVLWNGATFGSWLAQSSEVSLDSTLCTVLKPITRLAMHHFLLFSLLPPLSIIIHGLLKLPSDGSLVQLYNLTPFYFFSLKIVSFSKFWMWVFLCWVQERMNERLRNYEAALKRKKEEKLNELEEPSKFWIIHFYFIFCFFI